MTSVSALLSTSRKELLDLSTRNRLLSIPRQRKSAKLIEVKDELSAEIYRLLVKEGKALGFLPANEKQKGGDEAAVADEEGSDFGDLPQPEEDPVDERGVAKRHGDHRLQTLLTSEGLQRRLLTMYYDAKTFEEEQGVNILYLAIGMLKWFEDGNSEVERYAPLVLVPVTLERGSAAERFKLSWRKEECAANLSLQAKMKAEFGLTIPDIPEDDDFDVRAYMQSVQAAVSAKTRFEVLEDEMVLGFFSFAKFLMYRDLDPANWPESAKLDLHPLIVGLMRDGFPAVEGMIGEDENVDKHLTPMQMMHVVDADGSQTLAIEEVRRGRNLVIQGPPGTGKSQTITNIIASAVADGKKVLFVAEKMAALEVVHRRMENIGLGPLCVELHSHKANKRVVLEELRRTKELGAPRAHDDGQAAGKLMTLRDKLNGHVVALHATHAPSGTTAFQRLGHTVRLRRNGVETFGATLEEPQKWSADERREREKILAEAAAQIRLIGVPAQHIWRGACCPPMLPNEYDKLCGALVDLRQAYERLIEDVGEVERSFPNTDSSLGSLRLAAVIARAVASAPEINRSALAHPLWQNDAQLLAELAESGKQYAALKKRLESIVVDGAWDADWTECRQHVAIRGKSIFRFFSSGYRRSVALLRSFLAVPLPKAQMERLALIDEMMSAQKLKEFVKKGQETGASAFGPLWQGLNSDWATLMALAAWRNNLPVKSLPGDFLARCSRVEDLSQWREASSRLQKRVMEFFAKLDDVFKGLGFDALAAFGATQVDEIGRDAFAERLGAWANDTESLSKWIAFKNRHDALCAAGGQVFADKLWNGDMPWDKAQGAFERAYFDALTEDAFKMQPLLREFDGDRHDLLVADFREGDRKRIEQARIEIRNRHYGDMPRSDGGIGALGVLNGELAKKRNHLPIRKLMRRCGPAVQALKPVFMMSPPSVAQFLEPGALHFELLVVDEASQVEPVDALGAIARSKQIVVVGDSRQLPPTRFFSRMTGNLDDESDNEENTVASQDVESILNLCLARGLPQRLLRWHYRSRHQSLIAVSNREFYESKLFIVPSPYDASPDMGLKFNHLPHATFDGGGSATNSVEAKAVALAVVRHALERPNLSLGVGTFSLKQREAILNELELLRRTHPETEPFFAPANLNEPFFVKNLENIQGDERDVIFISVGYGRNSSGYMPMRFGPLNSEGGERRLNVLITRAKRRCEVFSSITADDIDLERAKGAGVAAFKLFLAFAQTGKLDIARASRREQDSVFEEQVAAALGARGYDVKAQVGIAGFFIDIAVVDREKPGRFLLGIECDGAAYHSSRSARDRDRLRQDVLEDHGWVIHRIWSADWFRRPKEQLEKAIAAIEQAKQARGSDQEKPAAQQVFKIASQGNGDAAALRSNASEKKLSIPYREATLPVPDHIEPHELSDQEMAAIVAGIVAVETPIHESEIVTRVRTLWKLARSGARIQAKVKGSLMQALAQGAVAQEGEFYLKPGTEVLVRDRGGVSSPGLRKPEHLPPHEIRKAILALVEASFGAKHDQLPSEVARLLGFKSTSAQLREIIEPHINELLKDGKLKENGEHITLAHDGIGHP